MTPSKARPFASVFSGLLLAWPPMSATAESEKPVEPVLAGEIAIESSKTGVGTWGRVVPGPDKEVWFQLPHSVARWNGVGLDPSPVKELRHPRWSLRSAPPWNHLRWGSELITLPGRKGSLLVVAFRDLYQDVARELGADADDNHALPVLVQRRLDAGSPLFWLEGWLFASGRWVGPLPIDQLVLQERKALVRDFDIPTPESRFFDLQSDGKTLWYAYNGSVGVIPPDGSLRIRRIPWSVASWRGLPPMNLILRLAGSVWCIVPSKTGFQTVELQLVRGGIESQFLERAKFDVPRALSGDNQWRPTLYLSRLNDMVMESERPRGNWPGRPVIHLLGDTGWTRRDDLGQVAFEDDDGSFWYVPCKYDGEWPENNAFRKVQGSGTTPVLPGYYRWSGPVTRLGPDRLVAPAEWRGQKHYLVVIDRASPGSLNRWKIGAHYAIPFTSNSQGFAVDRIGQLIDPFGDVCKLPASLQP